MSQVYFSNSLQVLHDFGISICISPILLRTTLIALYPYSNPLQEIRPFCPAKHMISGEISLFNSCSMYMLEENQNKVKGVVSAYRVVLAINDMTLYLGFNGININNISQVSTRNILSLASLLTGRSHRLCGHQFIGCNIEIWRKYEV